MQPGGLGGSGADRGDVRIDLGRFWDSQAETAALEAALAASEGEERVEQAFVVRSVHK